MTTWEKVWRSYWMKSKLRQDTGNCKRRDQIALCEELALEEAVDEP
jgi:hypothetical protein